MANKSRSERSNALALLASFFVIASGLAAAVVVCAISAPDPKYAIPAAVALFLLIAAIPFNAMRGRSTDLPGMHVKRPSLYKRILAWWLRRRKPKSEDDEAKVWKRKRIPKKTEGSIFVADSAQPPALG